MDRSRIKLKNKLNIFDVFIAKTLSDTTKLYMYVDDRNDTVHTNQDILESTLNTFKLFDIKVNVVRYSDYYSTAWIYLHKLITDKRVIVNYNTDCKSTDLSTIAKVKNVKMFYRFYQNNEINKLSQDTNDTFSDKYDTILYDNGWFRDIFIETVMDYSEQINCALYEDTDKPNVMINELRSNLKFSTPTPILTNLVSIIKKFNKVTSFDKTIADLSLDEFIKLSIDLKTVRSMIENEDVFLKSIATPLNGDCLINPTKVLFGVKSVLINEKLIDVCGVYLDEIELKTLGFESNLLNGVFKLKNIGCVKIIGSDCDNYTGEFIKVNKKKKNIKICQNVVLIESKAIEINIVNIMVNSVQTVLMFKQESGNKTFYVFDYNNKSIYIYFNKETNQFEQFF